MKKKEFFLHHCLLAFNITVMIVLWRITDGYPRMTRMIGIAFFFLLACQHSIQIYHISILRRNKDENRYIRNSSFTSRMWGIANGIWVIILYRYTERDTIFVGLKNGITVVLIILLICSFVYSVRKYMKRD